MRFDFPPFNTIEVVYHLKLKSKKLAIKTGVISVDLGDEEEEEEEPTNEKRRKDGNETK